MSVDILSREKIAEIDKENILGSVEALSDQCLDAWEQAKDIEVPDSYKKIDNIIMTGMGGSGLGARIIESVYQDIMPYPFMRINDYDLPRFTNKTSLVICSSYSGTTEETVQNATQAIEVKAKWMAIGTGNTLIDLAQKHSVPYYKIDPKYNPSNQPRMAIGYSAVGQLVMASHAGLFDLKHEDVSQAVNSMKKILDENKCEVPEDVNTAKKLARAMFGKNIFYVSSNHLVGATHTVNNQLNENAKVFSSDYVIPELNHHLMEGLKHPTANSGHLFMFFATSDLYPERISRRHEITMDVVAKNNIEFFEFKAKSDTKIAQAFELIQFGAIVNLYLSVLYEQNPAPIPWVDYFKTQLGQPLGK